MKRTIRPNPPSVANALAASDPLSILGRIKLSFLEESACEKRGYDPYDTSRHRAPDLWKSKRKRS